MTCRPAKNKCVCEDFQPSPSHDVFCLRCGCPASAHSNNATRGKRYTQCLASTGAYEDDITRQLREYFDRRIEANKRKPIEVK